MSSLPSLQPRKKFSISAGSTNGVSTASQDSGGGNGPHSASSINIATVDSTLAACMEMLPYDSKQAEHHKSIDRYSSLDSSDTFLSCNTHPFPSQGSLAGLEELAARGTMAPNGSMPAVNISGLNSVIVNPFDPKNKKKQRKQQQQQPQKQRRHEQHQEQQQQQQQLSTSGTLTPSPKGSPVHRRVRIASSRSLSSDNELEQWADCLEEAEEGSAQGIYRGMTVRSTEDSVPKHKRTRMTQVEEEEKKFLSQTLMPELFPSLFFSRLA